MAETVTERKLVQEKTEEGTEDLATGVEQLNIQDDGQSLQEKKVKLANLLKKEEQTSESASTTATQSESTLPVIEHYSGTTASPPSAVEPPSNSSPSSESQQPSQSPTQPPIKGETLIRFRRPVLTDDITSITSTYETLTLSEVQQIDPTWVSDDEDEEQDTQEDLEEVRLAMGEFDEVDEFEEVEIDEFEGDGEEAFVEGVGDWDVDGDHLEVEGYEDDEFVDEKFR